MATNETNPTTAAVSVKKPFPKELRQRLMIFGGAALLILIAAGVGAYLILGSNRVYVDTASISAPLINLAPTSAGRLNAVYVNEGDLLAANTPVALVGTEVITSKTAGLVVKVNDTVGAQASPGQAVVVMVDPSQLRVVGEVSENKGLSQLQVGDPVKFTVDAFGSKTFTGVLDQISPTSNASDIVFSVSDKRQEQSFDVKARFDTTEYPQLKNGMSARMWIYSQ